MEKQRFTYRQVIDAIMSNGRILDGYMLIRSAIKEDVPKEELIKEYARLVQLKMKHISRLNEVHNNQQLFEDRFGQRMDWIYQIDADFLIERHEKLHKFEITRHYETQFFYDGLPETKFELDTLVYEQGFVATDETIVDRAVINSSPDQKLIFLYFDFKIGSLGVKAMENIRANQLIFGYSGQVVSEKEAALIQRNNLGSYLVDFPHYGLIDARLRGNESRFVNNHCSEPTTSWCREGNEINFYAVRDLRPGETLTINYVPINDPYEDKSKRFNSIEVCKCTSRQHTVGKNAVQIAQPFVSPPRNKGKWKKSPLHQNKDSKTGKFVSKKTKED